MTIDDHSHGRGNRAATPVLEVIRGTSDAEELAALVAVVGDAYEREVSDAVATESPVSVWSGSRRSLRQPLRRDIPWGRFAG